MIRSRFPFLKRSPRDRSSLKNAEILRGNAELAMGAPFRTLPNLLFFFLLKHGY